MSWPHAHQGSGPHGAHLVDLCQTLLKRLSASQLQVLETLDEVYANIGLRYISAVYTVHFSFSSRYLLKSLHESP